MVKPLRAMRVQSCMDTNELYKEVEALRERLAQANHEIELEKIKSDQYRKQVETDLATERSKSEGYLQQVKALSATVEDQQGRLVEWLGKAKDINDRRTSQTALLESEVKQLLFCKSWIGFTG